MTSDQAGQHVIAISVAEPIDQVASKVASALGIILRPRESSYWGDPYYSAFPEGEVKLTLNQDPMYRDGDPPEDRTFTQDARDVDYLLWNAEPEAEMAERLIDHGLDARVVRIT